MNVAHLFWDEYVVYILLRYNETKSVKKEHIHKESSVINQDVAYSTAAVCNFYLYYMACHLVYT
jgi:hypothetical protein